MFQCSTCEFVFILPLPFKAISGWYLQGKKPFIINTFMFNNVFAPLPPLEFNLNIFGVILPRKLPSKCLFKLMSAPDLVTYHPTPLQVWLSLPLYLSNV